MISWVHGPIKDWRKSWWYRHIASSPSRSHNVHPFCKISGSIIREGSIKPPCTDKSTDSTWIYPISHTFLEQDFMSGFDTVVIWSYDILTSDSYQLCLTAFNTLWSSNDVIPQAIGHRIVCGNCAARWSPVYPDELTTTTWVAVPGFPNLELASLRWPSD